ncbi:hypothetical protein HID58_004126 [Brassica napus]|uniref:Uncharacterized protein n=1 Tax=Brassica napus TaxID=3708 RepID=A0ABQ8E4V7_BRANA|nr:hypothetical protein HID58_004126 [Brassica napus]
MSRSGQLTCYCESQGLGVYLELSQLSLDFDSLCMFRDAKSELFFKLVRALGVFAGGIFLMRGFGDLMAV